MVSKKEARGNERSSTGIAEFDKLCEGGFVNNSVNLVVGGAGSGKTTFMLQYLYNGASKFGENGLYVSFEQDVEELKKAGKKQGMDFDSLEKGGKIVFARYPAGTATKELESKLKALISKYKIERICFDTLNVFVVELPKQTTVRREVYDLFGLLKELGVTVLVSGEADDQGLEGQTLSEEITFSKYFVDGVVEIYSSGLGGTGDRAIRIAKMRMTKHVRGPQPMEITDKGIKLF